MATGGCHCGAVRYAFEAPPSDSNICHCQSCRRISRGLVVAWITVATDALKLSGALTSYKSSPPVTWRSCAACGSLITYTHDARPDEIDITTATLDDPSAFPPTHHSWMEDNITWVKFGDGLPSFATSRDT